MRKLLLCLLLTGCGDNVVPLPTCSSLGCTEAPWGDYSGPGSKWSPCTDPDLCYCPSAERTSEEAAACRPDPVSPPAPSGYKELGGQPVQPSGEHVPDPCCEHDPPASCFPPPGECVDYTCGGGFCSPPSS